MRTVGRSALALVSLLSAGVALTACTPSDRPSTQTGENTPAATAPAAQTGGNKVSKPSGPPCQPEQYQVGGEFGQKPTITVPLDCAPQDGLLSRDLKEGEGAEAKPGSTVTVNYELVTFSDGKTADSSFERGATFDVEDLGNAPVITGWNQGLVGIKEGGRRLLVIPAALGYGDQGNQGIKGGETLLFVVDAVSVK
ncbi:FKBP-type peptidyl-prolyl cis-trans isomerase [Actinosynnema pretiosum subsp. pretiosum]|uniref:Peptidyl-prolyl cis-trans isomerase n=2 Tax=Actinosynnema TaxID=40566 RepID=C6W8F3_ACTMD|nr:peptidylprolyl isomerase FKBP-type [Actinosynnema mirum DSM 43827]QUF03509.1 FKBP-type peptidyl-prolyl cis-trans isomerase [Actinosynnema pretiosum subsp. pretiosum]